MKAIILDHPKDIEIFKTKKKNLNFYAYNFHTYLKLLKKYKKVKYINDLKSLRKYENLLQKWSINWFIENRKKNFKYKKISVGNIILPRLINEFSNTLKNYFLIKKILMRNSQIFFPINQKKFISDIAKFFPNKIKFYNTRNKIERTLSANHLRSEIKALPTIHKLSPIARIIQNFFFLRKKKGTIYYPEAMTKNFFKEFKNILFLNSLMFWKSYYFRYSENHLLIAKKDLDLDFKNDLNKYLKSQETTQNVKLIDIFKICINKIVSKNKKNIFRTLSIYLELFDYYQPKSIIFPGALNFDYASAMEIAKLKKVKTFIALDGVSTNYAPTEFNKNYIFNKILAWGNQNRVLLEKHNIKKNDIILSRTPYKKVSNVSSKRNYTIVLPLMHYSQKVSSCADKEIYQTLNVLKVLNKLKKKNIILKLKDGNYDINRVRLLYNNLITEHKLQNISIKLGKLENYLPKAELIIGQCSSTIYEAVINNIKYHIYEPYDLGLSNEDVKNSKLFNRKSISRNPSELIKNLKKNKYSSIIKNSRQIFKGKKLKKDFFYD